MGGGGGKKSNTNSGGGTTTTEHEVAMRAMPAFMPGQQGLLAQQLAGGYPSTTPQEWSGILGQMYQPMSMPIINGAQDIAALRQQLDAQGVKTTTSSEPEDKKTDRRWGRR